MLDVAYTLLAQQADDTDRLLMSQGHEPIARAELDAALVAVELDDDESNVVELAAWVRQANAVIERHG